MAREQSLVSNHLSALMDDLGQDSRLMSNVILTGFMGTGNSSVGREVAQRLGWRFVDMDDAIVLPAGKPIPRIFAEDGYTPMDAAIYYEPEQERQAKLEIADFLRENGGKNGSELK